jgi:hypothetical protein
MTSLQLRRRPRNSKADSSSKQLGWSLQGTSVEAGGVTTVSGS